jgi:L-ascorbate metabolism protein UlaG (beta-lactamase superfamily)
VSKLRTLGIVAGAALLLMAGGVAASSNHQDSLTAGQRRTPKKSDHFDGTRFYNIGFEPWSSSPHRNGFFGVMKWMLTRHATPWKWRNNPVEAKPHERVYGKELVVTFVNHATVLIQTEGLNILTDPVWSERVSPVSFAGPKRYRPPGIRFDDLPPIDLILVSHNHYDHMDLPTLKRLRKAWKPPIFVGLRNAAYLKKEGVGGAEDMDWWDRKQIADSVWVTCVPGQHFSGRGFGDRSETLWCGFVIETPHGNIYFAGDTGYGPFLEQIKAHYRGFRLACLPIGAYLPRWFMKPIHESPDEALLIHKDLSVETSIAIHFGTFSLADDGQDQPPNRIKELLSEAPDPKPRFLVLENGEAATIP